MRNFIVTYQQRWMFLQEAFCKKFPWCARWGIHVKEFDSWCQDYPSKSFSEVSEILARYLLCSMTELAWMSVLDYTVSRIRQKFDGFGDNIKSVALLCKSNQRTCSNQDLICHVCNFKILTVTRIISWDICSIIEVLTSLDHIFVAHKFSLL